MSYNMLSKILNGGSVIEGQATMDSATFAKKKPALMELKHRQILEDTKRLGEIEKHLYINLQDIEKGSPQAEATEQAIQNRITKLKSMRMTLMGQLKTLYTDTQNRVTEHRGDLADQIAVGNIMQDELDNTDDSLKQLQDEKQAKLRMAKLGEYEYDRMYEIRSILQIVVYGLLSVLFFVLIMKADWFPNSVGIIGIVASLAISLIIVAKRIMTNMWRDNLDFERIDQGGKKLAMKMKTGTDEKNRRSLWDLLGSANCENASALAANAKKAAKKAAANAAGSESGQVENSTDEGFSNFNYVPDSASTENTFSTIN